MGNSKSTDAKGGSTKRKADDAPAADSKAGDSEPATKKAKAEKKTKKAAEAPFTWEEFQSTAKPLEVKFGADSAVRHAAVKQFSTGSYGWAYHGIDVVTVDGKEVPIRIGLNLSIANTKPKDGKKAEKEEESGDGKEEAGGDSKADAKTSEKFKKAEKEACPFADSKAFIAAAKALELSFGAAGAPATPASITPFTLNAAAKAFSTGSFGWGYNSKKKLEAPKGGHYDGVIDSVTVQVSCNITIANSKPAAKEKKEKKPAAKKGKKGAAAAAAAAADE